MVDTTFFKNTGPFTLQQIAEICGAELRDKAQGSVLVSDIATMAKRARLCHIARDNERHKPV